MMSSNTKKQLRLIFKWIILSFIIFLAFIIATTGGKGGAKPLLLIPIVIAISISENELVSGIVGAVSGLLVDLSCGKLLGTNGIYFLIIGVVASFLFLHLMRRNIINAIVLTVAVAFIHGMLDFFFYYAMWNYEKIGVVFREITIPSIIYTTISAPFVYIIIKWIVSKFAEREGIEVENSKLKGSKG